jgi:hypothetical protein
MGWIPDVIPNTVIAEQWGNDIRDAVVMKLDTATDFASIVNPIEGQYVHVENPPGLYVRDANTWRQLTKKDGTAWRWIDGAWGRLNSTQATVGNPGTDAVLSLTDYNPVTVQSAGFAPFAVTSPGNRVVQLSGVCRIDGGQLTSTSGAMEWYLRRNGASSDLATGIASVGSQTSGSLNTIAVVPLLAIDNPPQGTSTYSLTVRWRTGTGTLRLMVPVALMAADVGPTNVGSQTSIHMEAIQGL